MPPLDWIAESLREREAQHLLRPLSIRSGMQGRHLVVNGEHLLNFGSNDYLGLAGDERIVRAVRESLAHSGWGSGASPLVAGRTSLHAELEHLLAAFEHSEGALTFNSGFAANVGVISALANRDDTIFSDALNHASVIDGCRLSGAAIRVYRHTDMEHLEELLRTTPVTRRRLIVTDSLFSMDGDFAPLPQLVDLAQRFEAMLLVDEAHATGVWGDEGRGVAESTGTDIMIPVRVGTLSKALGSQGGFVVGSQSLISWCANVCRPYIFSTASPAVSAAAAIASLQIVQNDPQRRHTLQRTAQQLRETLHGMGLNIAHSTSQIIPIILGDAAKTVAIADQLRRDGLFVPAIRPPSVPHGTARLRISVTSLHQDDDLQQLVDSLRAAL